MVTSDLIKEISLEDMEGFHIGNAQNPDAGTGVTAIVFEKGAAVGCDISGGGPASRETTLTSPYTADAPVNAILLSGGSAFGLAAADGAMRCLEEHKIGFDTGFSTVPLVCQSCIFDLGYKSSTIRPDSEMGYYSCESALLGINGHGVSSHKDPFSYTYGLTHTDTQIGAGCGATVGKICGMERSSKAGIGYYAVSIGELKLASIVVVNALGDIHDPDNGKVLAGLKSEDGSRFENSVSEMMKIFQPRNLFTGNTTIGAVITNAKFSKAELTKIASMTRCAYSRCIRPVATMADGDTIYAASCGDVIADISMVGTLAAEVMGKAIENALVD